MDTMESLEDNNSAAFNYKSVHASKQGGKQVRRDPISHSWITICFRSHQKQRTVEIGFLEMMSLMNVLVFAGDYKFS